jgi:hypothetical protein
MNVSDNHRYHDFASSYVPPISEGRKPNNPNQENGSRVFNFSIIVSSNHSSLCYGGVLENLA